MRKTLYCLVMMSIMIMGFASVVANTALAGDELKIVGESFPPYKYVEDGQLVGIDIEIARHIFDTLGVQYDIEILPWARCWLYLQTGRADVGLAVSKKMAREEYVLYPENHVWDASFVFLVNDETKAAYSIGSLDDVKKSGLKVGVIRGNSYHESFWKAFPWQDTEKTNYHPQLRPLATVEDCLKALKHNRVNLYPIPRTIGLYTVKKMGLSNISAYDAVLFSKPYPNVFSKASTFTSDKYSDIAEVMAAYDRELGVFRETPAYQAIIDKYEK